MRIEGMILGAVLVFWGIMVLIQPKFYDRIYSYHFDFTGYNIPLGIFMIAVGALFIWTTLKRNKDKDKEKE